MSGHTKGPWEADVNVSDGRGWNSPTQHVVISSHDNIIAAYATDCAEYPDDAENAANARLIAAAPDLLAALQEMMPAFEMRMADTENVEWHGCWNKAIAAVAKATGAQP